MTEYALPTKILAALRRLRLHYGRRGESDLSELLDSASVHVEPGTDHDNWNGGTWGHDVHMFIHEERMGLIDLEKQSDICKRLREDLNKATPEVEDEYFRAVYVRSIDNSDPQCQAAIPLSRHPQARPEDVGLWKDNALRLFVSHRDHDKVAAQALADALEEYGVSSFVAHGVIKPMKEWQKEILNSLATMEVMLVLLTKYFHDSEWTNQEVGFALGRGIPIICVKAGPNDPKGFIGSRQALKVDADAIASAAPDVLKALLIAVGQAGRIKEIMIEAFIRSRSYTEAMQSLKRLTETAEQLTDKDLRRIVKGYQDNDQLHGCGGIHNRGNWFKRYLESATGKRLEFRERLIREVGTGSDDELPF